MSDLITVFRPSAMTWLVLTQLAGAISLVPWAFVGFMILIHLDGLNDVSTGVVLIGSYPLVVIGASVTAWKMLGKNRLLTACLITALPIVFALFLVTWY